MSRDTHDIRFPPFRLDLRAQSLTRGSETIALRPKTWDLLRYFVERPGRLVSKDELMEAVWGDVTVTISSLNQAVLELRKVLGDDAREPEFIETVHRKGFRFIARMAEPDSVERPSVHAERERLIGRDADLQRLDTWAGEAFSGHRRFVFITGEPGIGKSSLLETFVRGLDPDRVHVAGGRCVELLGEGEAYLPVLEALDRFARGSSGPVLRSSLRRYAPTWLVQMPWLIDDEAEGPGPIAGSPMRMLREFCVAVEELATDRPTVLWLEDLHWSDPSTVDLINALARQVGSSRLLVLATYRPTDAAMRDHPIAPLKRRLVQQGSAYELSLEFLEPDAVGEFVAETFGAIERAKELVDHLVEHSDGNPLYLEAMTRDLISKKWAVRDDDGWHLTESIEVIRNELPESLRQIVEERLDRLTEEESSVIEVASVVGEAFSSGAVALAHGADETAIEEVCVRLARWGGIIRHSEPSSRSGGPESPRFEFIHQVYRRILYEHNAPARRRRIHLDLARGLEATSPAIRTTGPAEMALHFEYGGDHDRAIEYLVRAADGLRRRFAGREAAGYLERALELLAGMPESDARDNREVELRHRLARVLIHAGGDTAERQRTNLARALDLGRKLDAPRHQLVSLAFLTGATLRSGNLDRVRDLVEESRNLAPAVDEPVLGNHFRSCSGVEATLRGEHERSSKDSAACLAGLEGVDPRVFAEVSPLDFTIMNRVFSGWSAWLTGRPDTAREWTRRTRERAEDSRTGPFVFLVVLPMMAIVELFRRDRAAVDEHRQAFVDRLREFGIPWPFAHFPAVEGWLEVQAGNIEAGIERLREGVATVRACGEAQALSLLLATLVEAELTAGRSDEGLTVLDEAMEFVDLTGERFWEAELHRLRGEMLLLDDHRAAEESFRKSLGVARRQGALSLELRGAASLARLLCDSDRIAEGRTLLSGVYNRFDEGFDTLDLIEAKVLLERL